MNVFLKSALRRFIDTRDEGRHMQRQTNVVNIFLFHGLACVSINFPPPPPPRTMLPTVKRHFLVYFNISWVGGVRVGCRNGSGHTRKEKNPAYGRTLIRAFSVLVWTISIPRENALQPADRGFTNVFMFGICIYGCSLIL